MISIPPLAFHAPDGFFSLPIIIGAWVLFIIAVAYVLYAGKRSFKDDVVPKAGIMAAFIFGVQTINFPIFGGTSAHLLGATLSAIVLGLPITILVMLVVVFLQALLFQDGGVIAFGVNALNLAVIAPIVGVLAFKAASKLSARWKKGGGRYVVAGVSAWVSVVVTSAFLALELTVSGTSPPEVAFPVLVGVNALAGIVEGIATAAALTIIVKAKIGNFSPRIGANT